MNIISKRFVEHKNYALKTVEDVLTPEAVKKATKFTVNTLFSGYLENNNGVFSSFKPFPKELQTAPITNFNSIEIAGEKGIIISGNSLSVNTYHGGYTSLKGVFLKSITDYNFVSDYGIYPFNTQIKDVKSIQMKRKNQLLVISNNDSLQTYSYKK